MLRIKAFNTVGPHFISQSAQVGVRLSIKIFSDYHGKNITDRVTTIAPSTNQRMKV